MQSEVEISFIYKLYRRSYGSQFATNHGVIISHLIASAGGAFSRGLKASISGSRIKLNHLAIGHPTTTASLSINAYFLHHHQLKMDPREVAIQSTITDLASSVKKSQRAACKK
jgi:hypothetical protein